MEIVIQYESRMIPIPGPDGQPRSQEGAAFKVSILNPAGKSEDLCFTLTPNYLEFIARLKKIGRLIENANSVMAVGLGLGAEGKKGENQSGEFTISTLGSEQSDLTAAAWVLLNKLASEANQSIQEVAQAVLAAESKEDQIGK